MLSYKKVLQISFIIFIILIIFVSVSWVFPTLMPTEYYMNAILAISTASAILELIKIKSGTSTIEVMECLNKHSLSVAIRSAKDIRSTDDSDKIFEAMKNLTNALQDTLIEET